MIEVWCEAGWAAVESGALIEVKTGWDLLVVSSFWYFVLTNGWWWWSSAEVRLSRCERLGDVGLGSGQRHVRC